jgi:hypothetical protein
MAHDLPWKLLSDLAIDASASALADALTDALTIGPALLSMSQHISNTRIFID